MTRIIIRTEEEDDLGCFFYFLLFLVLALLLGKSGGFPAEKDTSQTPVLESKLFPMPRDLPRVSLCDLIRRPHHWDGQRIILSGLVVWNSVRIENGYQLDLVDNNCRGFHLWAYTTRGAEGWQRVDVVGRPRTYPDPQGVPQIDLEEALFEVAQ